MKKKAIHDSLEKYIMEVDNNHAQNILALINRIEQLEFKIENVIQRLERKKEWLNLPVVANVQPPVVVPPHDFSEFPSPPSITM